MKTVNDGGARPIARNLIADKQVRYFLTSSDDPARTTMDPDAPLCYMPSAYYFRRAIRSTDDIETLREIALTAVRELEWHKQWMREEHGLIPPKRYVMLDEISEKPWLQARQLHQQPLMASAEFLEAQQASNWEHQEAQ